MKNKKTLHMFTKILMDIMFFSGILVCAAVPFAVNIIGEYSSFIKSISLQITIVLLISGLMALYILWSLRKIFKTIVTSDPFTLDNIRILRRIAVAAFVISVAYLAKCAFWFTLATALIILIFTILGLFCLVLADVFQQAVQYKEENDLTI